MEYIDLKTLTETSDIISGNSDDDFDKLSDDQKKCICDNLIEKLTEKALKDNPFAFKTEGGFIGEMLIY